MSWTITRHSLSLFVCLSCVLIKCSSSYLFLFLLRGKRNIKMGQKQSKDQLLYQHVVNGNIQAIHALCTQGASLEWKDKEGRTPLIMAAKDPRLYGVAKTLIELGANVNAFSRAHHGGTPLHYAAKEGIHSTVALLLSHGANAFVKNRDDKTPLDIARKNGRSLVVREIESRICYFAGHIRETFGPGFSDASAPQLSSRVIWVVVVPRKPHNPPKSPKLELVIYTNPQDDKPRKIIFPKSTKIKEPKLDQPNPVLIIKDQRKETRYKFSSVTEGDKQQLRRLYNACKGMSQVMPVSSPIHTEALGTPFQATTANTNTQPIPFSSRNSFDYTIGSPIPSPSMMPQSSIWMNQPQGVEYRGPESWTPPNQSPQIGNQANFQPSVPVQMSDRTLPAVASPSPSAPPASPDELFIPDDVSIAATPSMPVAAEDRLDSSLCVICWDARVEGACVPCGHVSSCMACLQEIKAKNGVCPVCRSEINQVVKLYGI